MKTTKTFDLGIYTYRPQYFGSLRHQDEAKLCTGDVFAVLHPMLKADPGVEFCFAITPAGDVLTILRKNLKMNRAISLNVPVFEGNAIYAQEIHAKYDKARLYLRSQPGQEAVIDFPQHVNA